MNALTKNGIDESTIHIGTVLNVTVGILHANVLSTNVVTYLEKNEDGKITAIAFAGIYQIFTNRHKLNVTLPDENEVTAMKSEGDMIAKWYQVKQDCDNGTCDTNKYYTHMLKCDREGRGTSDEVSNWVHDTGVYREFVA